MTKTFTHLDLVKYLYNETSHEENQIISILLATDDDFLEKLEELLDIKNEIDNFAESPSEETIQNILNYSKGCHFHSV